MRLALTLALLAGAAQAEVRMTQTVLEAKLTLPTQRYNHGVLGDTTEWGGLDLLVDPCVTCMDGPPNLTLRITLPQNRVFEDVTVRIADVDGERGSEAIVVETDLALGASLFAAYDWTRTQFYIGDDGVNVAIYRGIPQDLGPIHLSSVEEVTAIPLSDLPPFERSAVDATIGVANEAEAQARVEILRQTAQACRLMRSQGTACGSGGS